MNSSHTQHSHDSSWLSTVNCSNALVAAKESFRERPSLSSVRRLENVHKHVLLRLEQREITMRQTKNPGLRKAVRASRCTRRSRWTAWISDRIPRSYMRIAPIITAMLPAIWMEYKKISVLRHQLSSLLKIFQSILESLHVFGPGPWKCREKKHSLGPPHSHLVLLQPDHVETAPCKNMQSHCPSWQPPESSGNFFHRFYFRWVSEEISGQDSIL